MSPRAACRLAALGFSELYDYVAGKADWLAHNLPIEGEHADLPTAGRLLRTDFVTCAPDDPACDIGPRIDESPYGFALVTSQAGVLLGRVRRSVLPEAAAKRAEEIMESGPSTVRPHSDATQLGEQLARRNLETAIVTTPEGQLLGVVTRGELEQAAAKRPRTSND